MRRGVMVKLISVFIVAAMICSTVSACTPKELEEGMTSEEIKQALADLWQEIGDIELIPGTPGPEGPAGPEGSAGPQGIQGEIGPQGAAGLEGLEGPAGAQGIHGAMGPQGPGGPQGSAGPQGEQGIQGETGPQGTQGPEGAQGPAGPQGEQGIQGETGPQGPPGTTSWTDGAGKVTTTVNVGIGTATPGIYKLNVQGGAYGVYGEGTGSYGYGLYGEGTGSYGCGVYALGTGSSSYGVRSESTDAVGFGVWSFGKLYNFYAAGPGTDYGTFTGGHEVKLADGFPEEIKPGTIVSVTGETQVRFDNGQITFSSTLPTVRLADKPDDSRVFGVLVAESTLPDDHWYTNESDEGDRFGVANALGEGRVWVTDINGGIEAGDYITTSAIAGYGQKQDDDLLHSYTLGKAIENVDWSTVTETVEYNGQAYKAYPIAVVYTSG